MKQLLITNLCYPQVAIMRQGRLCRLVSDSEMGQAGDIYLAKVVRVLPALAVAFLDIGEGKNAILSLLDTSITVGQLLIVQLSRPAHAQKGAIATTAITLSSPYIVYKPQGAGIGVSTKLPKDKGQFFKKHLTDCLKNSSIKGGVVVRTLAQDIDPAVLVAHILYLYECWQGVLTAKSISKTPQRLYRTPLPLAALNDETGITSLLIDDRVMYDEWSAFAEQYLPSIDSVTYHTPSLFDTYHVYTQLNNALNVRVDLPSGAYLVINECEAMTVIDVNTGSLTHSSKNIIYQANLEAVQAVADALILRQIGGLVVVDLINMKNLDDQKAIYQAFQQVLADDTAKVVLAPMSQFGLIELSREHRLSSLSDKYTHDCSACHGVGKVKALPTIALAIVAKLTSLSHTLTAKDELVLRVGERLHAFLANDKAFKSTVVNLPCLCHIKIMADYPDDKHDILQNKRR